MPGTDQPQRQLLVLTLPRKLQCVEETNYDKMQEQNQNKLNAF